MARRRRPATSRSQDGERRRKRSRWTLKDEAEQETWEIEYITEVRSVKDDETGRYLWEFKIKWLGWDHKDDTWEPEASFIVDNDILDSFWDEIYRLNPGLRGKRAHHFQGQVFAPSSEWIRQWKESAVAATDLPNLRELSPVIDHVTGIERQYLQTKNARAQDDANYGSESSSEDEEEYEYAANDDSNEETSDASSDSADSDHDSGNSEDILPYYAPLSRLPEPRGVARIPANPIRRSRKEKTSATTATDTPAQPVSALRNSQTASVNRPSSIFVKKDRPAGIIRQNKNKELVSHPRGSIRAKPIPLLGNGVDCQLGRPRIPLLTPEEIREADIEGQRLARECLDMDTQATSQGGLGNRSNTEEQIEHMLDSQPSPEIRMDISPRPESKTASSRIEQDGMDLAAAMTHPAAPFIHPERLALMQADPSPPRDVSASPKSTWNGSGANFIPVPRWRFLDFGAHRQAGSPPPEGSSSLGPAFLLQSSHQVESEWWNHHSPPPDEMQVDGSDTAMNSQARPADNDAEDGEIKEQDEFAYFVDAHVFEGQPERELEPIGAITHVNSEAPSFSIGELEEGEVGQNDQEGVVEDIQDEVEDREARFRRDLASALQWRSDSEDDT